MPEIFHFKASNLDILAYSNHSFHNFSAIYYRNYLVSSDSKSLLEDLSKYISYMRSDKVNYQNV